MANHCIYSTCPHCQEEYCVRCDVSCNCNPDQASTEDVIISEEQTEAFLSKIKEESEYHWTSIARARADEDKEAYIASPEDKYKLLSFKNK